MIKRSNSNGYITLISILIISSIAVTLALTLTLISVGSSQSSVTYTQSRQADAYAAACAEEAMEQLKTDVNYIGSNGLNIGTGTCSYEVINNGGQDRTVNASGTAGQATRRVKVLLTAASPTFTIISWQSVADF
jgi:hypothetical protein